MKSSFDVFHYGQILWPNNFHFVCSLLQKKALFFISKSMKWPDFSFNHFFSRWALLSFQIQHFALVQQIGFSSKSRQLANTEMNYNDVVVIRAPHFFFFAVKIVNFFCSSLFREFIQKSSAINNLNNDFFWVYDDDNDTCDFLPELQPETNKKLFTVFNVSTGFSRPKMQCEPR